MRIFISYARTDECIAAEIELALRAEGHEVFLDRPSLRAGAGFHRQIREQIESADALVFLVSPASVRPGSYALTELKFAQARWRSPEGKILPTLVEPTPLGDLPPYLRAVTILDPAGNVSAEIAAAVAQWDTAHTVGVNSKVRVLMHAACFIEEPERPAFFINVTNLSTDRDAEVTHVWIETTPKTYAIPPTRPLPVRLRPFESWETWVYFDELPSIEVNHAYEMARVRLSAGDEIPSIQNAGVPELGFVPIGKGA